MQQTKSINFAVPTVSRWNESVRCRGGIRSFLAPSSLVPFSPRAVLDACISSLGDACIGSSLRVGYSEKSKKAKKNRLQRKGKNTTHTCTQTHARIDGICRMVCAKAPSRCVFAIFFCIPKGTEGWRSDREEGRHHTQRYRLEVCGGRRLNGYDRCSYGRVSGFVQAKGGQVDKLKPGSSNERKLISARGSLGEEGEEQLGWVRRAWAEECEDEPTLWGRQVNFELRCPVSHMSQELPIGWLARAFLPRGVRAFDGVLIMVLLALLVH